MDLNVVHRTRSAPVSLNAWDPATSYVTLPQCRQVTIQPGLFTTPAAYVLFRIDDSTSEDAAALDNCEGFLLNGGTVTLHLNPFGQYYLWLQPVDAGGTAVTLGASDYLYMFAEGA